MKNETRLKQKEIRRWYKKGGKNESFRPLRLYYRVKKS